MDTIDDSYDFDIRRRIYYANILVVIIRRQRVQVREHVDKCASVSVKVTLTYSTWAGCIENCPRMGYNLEHTRFGLSGCKSRQLKFDCSVGVSNLELIIFSTLFWFAQLRYQPIENGAPWLSG